MGSCCSSGQHTCDASSTSHILLGLSMPTHGLLPACRPQLCAEAEMGRRRGVQVSVTAGSLAPPCLLAACGWPVVANGPVGQPSVRIRTAGQPPTHLLYARPLASPTCLPALQEPDAGAAQGSEAVYQRHNPQRLPQAVPGALRALAGAVPPWLLATCRLAAVWPSLCVCTTHLFLSLPRSPCTIHSLCVTCHNIYCKQQLSYTAQLLRKGCRVTASTSILKIATTVGRSHLNTSTCGKPWVMCAKKWVLHAQA